MKGPNQIAKTRADVHVTAKDLLTVPDGEITEAGLRWNIDVGVAVSRSMAARRRLRADLQPDGRRRHGRDLPRASVAMGEARGETQRRANGNGGAGAPPGR